METLKVRPYHTLLGVEMAALFLARQRKNQKLVVEFTGNALPWPILTVERTGETLTPVINPVYRRWVRDNGCDPRFICRCA